MQKLDFKSLVLKITQMGDDKIAEKYKLVPKDAEVRF